jgi:ABC-type lipoprotein export system ATPase subunit
MNKAISTNSITRSFIDGLNQIKVLNQLSLDVELGEKIAITGASGSGKTTLMQILAGIDNASSGSVELFGKDISTYSDKLLSKIRNEQIGFIYQSYHLLPEFTVLENVALPLMIRGMVFQEARVKALKMLKEVEMNHRESFFPEKLSGGEKQRTAIARALIIEPKIIFADEPTGNLDSAVAVKIINQLLELVSKHHSTLVLVTHDSLIASKMDRTLMLKNGILIQQ